jgi:hypothetical protein
LLGAWRHMKGVQPYVVHATYQFSHSLGKRQRMREAGLWTRDPHSYYTQGDFLSFDPTPPRQLVADISGGLIARHMRVAAFYRHSVRNALALATVLNRTLIVPPFQCYCDRWWGNVLPTCLIPGARAPASHENSFPPPPHAICFPSRSCPHHCPPLSLQLPQARTRRSRSSAQWTIFSSCRIGTRVCSGASTLSSPTLACPTLYADHRAFPFTSFHIHPQPSVSVR